VASLDSRSTPIAQYKINPVAAADGVISVLKNEMSFIKVKVKADQTYQKWPFSMSSP
jgi:hypothetical protein